MRTRLQRLTSPPKVEERYSWDEYVELVIANTWTATVGQERSDYGYYLERNPIVFAAVRQRLQMFTQAVFKWQTLRNGRPGDLFGTPDLRLLEEPAPGWGIADLLAVMELDVSMRGNAYVWRFDDNELMVLKPEWVQTVTEEFRFSRNGPVVAQRVVGYEYTPGGTGPSQFIDPEQTPICHFWEIPSPTTRTRGMSWVQAALTEVKGDQHLSDYKVKFFEHAATPNLAIKSQQPLTDEQMGRLREQMERRHQGVENAHRTLIIEGGAEIEKVGAGLGELSYTQVQDAGENRIALASGVPAPLIGIQLGTNPTYNNFNTARRHFADAWARPQWRRAAAALGRLLTPPNDGVRLWYDDRDIEALQQDADDEAAIRQKDAATLRQLVDGGFTPESAVQFVSTSDPTVLEHTGNLSVQLLPDGEVTNV